MIYSPPKPFFIAQMQVLPEDWDVDFKLYAPGNTIIEAKLKNGKVEDLNVTPASREKDLILLK